jgi:hypothetical protein
VRHREPEAHPAEFEDHVHTHDVDGDGLDDLVRDFPTLPVPQYPNADFAGLPPALVAHRLADGRYALDDEVTRTALRALCPAAPARRVFDAPDAESYGRGPFFEAIFLDGFCLRVWGASSDAAEAHMRAVAAASAEGIFTAETLDTLTAALRAMPVPIELDALEAEPIPLVRETSNIVRSSPWTIADPRCNAVHRANDALRSRANRTSLPFTGPDGPSLEFRIIRRDDQCMASAQGVWSITWTSFSLVQGRHQAVHAPAFLTWRPTAAPATPIPPLRLGVESRGMSNSTFWIRALYDDDGDGTPEVLVEHDEGSRETSREMFTVRGGLVRTYTPSHALPPFDDVTDADHDGRPDFVLRSPWHLASHCEVSNTRHVGPPVLAHALPDGSFSTSDEVARAWTLARCARTSPEAPEGPDVLDVACARLRGTSAERLVAALHARTPAGPQRIIPSRRRHMCLTFQELASMALVPLPFEATR